MGGDLLSEGRLSNGGGSDSPPRSLKNFFREQCPYYMAMGMTYDEFYHGDPSLTKVYFDASRIRQKYDNIRQWRQGMYFYEALCDASPILRTSFSKKRVSPIPYPTEPYPLDDQEAQERKEREAKRKMLELRSRFLADVQRINTYKEDAQNAE